MCFALFMRPFDCAHGKDNMIFRVKDQILQTINYNISGPSLSTFHHVQLFSQVMACYNVTRKSKSKCKEAQITKSLESDNLLHMKSKKVTLIFKFQVYKISLKASIPWLCSCRDSFLLFVSQWRQFS